MVKPNSNTDILIPGAIHIRICYTLKVVKTKDHIICFN